MQDSSQSSPQPTHPSASLPCRVADLHTQPSSTLGSRAFLGFCACGWMQGGMGKGESTDQMGITTQSEKEKENRKKIKTEQDDSLQGVTPERADTAGHHAVLIL